MNVPELRSPFVTTEGIYYFARMFDKIRLHAAGHLPAEYQANLGSGFDGRAIKFLWIEYPALVERVKEGGTDEEILEWAFSQGHRPSETEVEIWNGFMCKNGWKDAASQRLAVRKRESNLQDRDDIQTFFDYIDADEGRELHPRP